MLFDRSNHELRESRNRRASDSFIAPLCAPTLHFRPVIEKKYNFASQRSRVRELSVTSAFGGCAECVKFNRSPSTNRG